MRHYVSPSPLSSHHRPSPGQQLMTCLAARRQISTEIEAVRWWSTSAEHAVPRLFAIRLESVRRTAVVRACGLP